MGACQCKESMDDIPTSGGQHRSSSLTLTGGKSAMDIFSNKMGKSKHEKSIYSFDQQEKLLADFEILKKIGQGSYGTVYLVQCISEKKKKYAMKMIPKSSLQDEKYKEHALNEKNVLASNDHLFLLRLYYSFQTDSHLFLIVDYAEGGDLFLNMKYKQKFSDSDVAFYCAEIIVALEYLHSKGIIYRDLKPENILITKQGHIKLADFGLSKIKNYRTERAQSKCGTPDYIAPEIAMGSNGYTEQADIWSLGMMVYELYHGFPPFFSKDKKKQIESCVSKDIMINSKIHVDTQDFIRKLLQPDPEKRIGLTGLEELKEHPFFKNIDWGKAERGELDPPKPISKDLVAKEIAYLNKNQYPDSQIDLSTRIAKGSFLDGFTFDHTQFTQTSLRQTDYNSDQKQVVEVPKEKQINQQQIDSKAETLVKVE